MAKKSSGAAVALFLEDDGLLEFVELVVDVMVSDEVCPRRNGVLVIDSGITGEARVGYSAVLESDTERDNEFGRFDVDKLDDTFVVKLVFHSSS